VWPACAQAEFQKVLIGAESYFSHNAGLDEVPSGDTADMAVVTSKWTQSVSEPNHGVLA
jgi:hypothetical protein